MTKMYAVIPSCCRLEELTALAEVLTSDGVEVIVIDTGYVFKDIFPLMDRKIVRCLVKDRDTKNISRWWNRGLDLAESDNREFNRDEEYIVGIFNDDVVIQPGFMPALTEAILESGAAGAFPGVSRMSLSKPSFIRMTGFAFALRGSLRLRADENMAWWYGDNDLEYQCYRNGGLEMVPLSLDHLYPNSTTVGDLAEQAGRDRQTFIDKWGNAPW